MYSLAGSAVLLLVATAMTVTVVTATPATVRITGEGGRLVFGNAGDVSTIIQRNSTGALTTPDLIADNVFLRHGDMDVAATISDLETRVTAIEGGGGGGAGGPMTPKSSWTISDGYGFAANTVTMRSYLLDDNVSNNNLRFTTSAAQTGAEWFQIDLAGVVDVSGVCFGLAGPAGSARHVSIRASVDLPADQTAWEALTPVYERDFSDVPIGNNAGVNTMIWEFDAPVSARYLYWRQLGTTAGEWLEFTEVFVASLPRASSWVFSTHPETATSVLAMTDTNILTNWNTNTAMVPGHHITADMRASKLIYGVYIVSFGHTDYARSLDIQVSAVPVAPGGWASVPVAYTCTTCTPPPAVGYGLGANNYRFPVPVVGRYIRLTQQGTSGNHWSTVELFVY